MDSASTFPLRYASLSDGSMLYSLIEAQHPLVGRGANRRDLSNMARPRVFVSSTYYDLRTIRADLDSFIRELGYEPVLFERGHIPYGSDEALEEYCYREITTCDILIAIVGGQFGSESSDTRHSISQRELKIAFDEGKQVYIFVDRSVFAEYKTFLANKNVKGFTPVSVNDKRVFEFLDEIYGFPSGNPIEPFDVSYDIVRFLREQWAGLFQRLLQERARQPEINLISKLRETASTLDHLVTFLTEQRTKGDSAIKDILLSTHPAFAAVKETAKIPYRIVFHTFSELHALLEARQFKRDETPSDDSWYEWDNYKVKYGIRVNKSVFDDNEKLRVITPEEWNEEWVSSYPLASQRSKDDDIPF